MSWHTAGCLPCCGGKAGCRRHWPPHSGMCTPSQTVRRHCARPASHCSGLFEQFADRYDALILPSIRYRGHLLLYDGLLHASRGSPEFAARVDKLQCLFLEEEGLGKTSMLKSLRICGAELSALLADQPEHERGVSTLTTEHRHRSSFHSSSPPPVKKFNFLSRRQSEAAASVDTRRISLSGSNWESGSLQSQRPLEAVLSSMSPPTRRNSNQPGSQIFEHHL